MPQECHAIEIAAGLRLEWGDAAADQARLRANRAEALGHIARCDLYRAVCSVLANREQAIWRSHR